MSRVDRSLRRDILTLTPSYVVPGIASLVSIPLIFHFLGGAGYGTLALALGVANGVPLATGGWLEALALRFAGRSPGQAMGRLTAVVGVLSVLLGSGGAALLIPGADASLVAATGLLTGLTATYGVAIARLQGQLDFTRASAAASIRATAGSLAGIVLAGLTGSPTLAILGLAAGFALGAVVAALARGREPAAVARGREPAARTERDGGGPAARGERARLAIDSEAGRYALASFAASAGSYILAVNDRFVLSLSQSLLDVGRYAATYAFADMVFRLLPSVTLGAIRPRVFRRWDAGERESAIDELLAATAVLAWVMAWLVVGLVAAASVLPALAVDPGLAGPIAIGLDAFVVGNALAIVLAAQTRQARVARNVVVAAAINVSLNLILIPRAGVLAAAITTAIAYVVYLGLNVTALRGVGFAPDRRAVAVLGLSFLAGALGALASLRIEAAVLSVALLVALAAPALGLARRAGLA